MSMTKKAGDRYNAAYDAVCQSATFNEAYSACMLAEPCAATATPTDNRNIVILAEAFAQGHAEAFKEAHIPCLKKTTHLNLL